MDISPAPEPRPVGTLAGRVALVTGAGRGIGRACALALARRGADLVLTARSDAALAEVGAALAPTGRAVLTVACDLSEPGAADALLGQAHARFPAVDILVNNAARSGPLGPTARIDPDEWERTLALNLTAPVRLGRRLLPGMLARGWGRIVNVTSGAAAGSGLTGANAYSVSKAGLEHFTRNLAAEVAGTGVLVNTVRPGVVDTSMQAGMRAPGNGLDAATRAVFTELDAGGALARPEAAGEFLADVVQSEVSGRTLDARTTTPHDLGAHAPKPPTTAPH
ncbi:SDR family NAD(P)-dependent oxidoreductase [Streptomyces similanensis]|uniref:3-oxoacyl-[acyl-carrier-protein] reductase n=1 Tax=Streptomyces similanensis TaxID=1274988 RepID=A0ABP9LPC1_9ACTN